MRSRSFLMSLFPRILPTGCTYVAVICMMLDGIPALAQRQTPQVRVHSGLPFSVRSGAGNALLLKSKGRGCNPSSTPATIIRCGILPKATLSQQARILFKLAPWWWLRWGIRETSAGVASWL